MRSIRVLPFLLLPLLMLGAKLAAASGLAFVVNSGSASISLIDMSTEKELRRIPVLREPHHLVLSPDGKSLLVGDTAGNEMLFLDPATGAVQQRMPVADPYQLGFSPNGKFLVVNGLARNQVDVYDAATMQLMKRFPVASMPSHLAFSPDSRDGVRQPARHRQAGGVRSDRHDGRCGPSRSARRPAGVLWQNGKVLVADMGTDYVAVVDPADGRVMQPCSHRQRRAQPVPVAGPKDPLGQQPRRRHHHVAGRGHADADPHLQHSRRPGRHRLRARRQAVDHPALRGESRGAGSRDRRLRDDRRRPLAARAVPEPGSAPRRRVSRRADPWMIRSISPPAGCRRHLLIPLLYALGLMQWEDLSYGWALFAVYGAVQVA